MSDQSGKRLVSFDWHGDRSEQIAEYRAHPVWKRIWSFLGGKLWHATTEDNWRLMQATRGIEPNVGGRFSMRYQLNTEKSYSYIHDCVALFDLETASEEKVIRRFDCVWDIITGREETLILMELDANKLRSDIIPNSAAYESPEGYPELPTWYCVPELEVWYPRLIPWDAVINQYELKDHRTYHDFAPQPIIDTSGPPFQFVQPRRCR